MIFFGGSQATTHSKPSNTHSDQLRAIFGGLHCEQNQFKKWIKFGTLFFLGIQVHIITFTCFDLSAIATFSAISPKSK
jgi:hypothetical protein